MARAVLPARIGEERRTLPSVVEGAVRFDQGQSLAHLEVVELHGAHDRVLILWSQSRQRQGELRPDGSLLQPRLDALGEARGERVALPDPRRLLAHLASHDLRRVSVLVDQRRDDAPLVERTRRPPRRVGLEHEELGLERARCVLDDDGDLVDALRAPALQPLEPIDQLVRPVVACEHAERQVGRSPSRRSSDAGAKRSEARPEPVDLDQSNVGLRGAATPLTGRRGRREDRHG